MYNNNKKRFLTKLQGLSQYRSPHRVFSDWLEIAAISMHQLPYHSQELARDDTFEKLEQLYLERIQPYSRDELNVFGGLIGLTLAAHQTAHGDFLGEIAGASELLNKRSGQFFTPYHLCQAIAKMTLGNVRSLVEEKGLITVCEPAVGAGALVIASAEEITRQGVDPRACIQFDCTDVSRDAFNMAYIQLCAQNLQALVHHGNTLSMEYWESRPTPQLRLFSQWVQSKRKEQQMTQAIRSLFSEDHTLVRATNREDATAATVVISSETSFDSEQFVERVEKSKGAQRVPDVVLHRQMSLFE